MRPVTQERPVPTVAKSGRLAPHARGAIERLAAPLRLSPVVAQLLLNRGLTEPDVARRFLESPLSGLHTPERLPGAAAAAERLHQAVLRKRRICIYGDY